MSAEQWEALAIRAALWEFDEQPDPDPALERVESDMGAKNHGCCSLYSFAGLALFAHAMALLTSEEQRFTGETDPLGPGDFANGNMDDHEGFFRMGGRFLFDALRAFHAGTDRGELRALLVEAWGPSPAVSDLRGLAARESQPARNIRDAPAADELADLSRGPRL